VQKQKSFLSIILLFFGVSLLLQNNISLAQKININTIIKSIKEGESIKEPIGPTAGEITKRKKEEMEKLETALHSKQKIDEEYKNAVGTLIQIAISNRENLLVRCKAFTVLANLKEIDNHKELNSQRKNLFINFVKNGEYPLIRAEVIIVGVGQFLLLRKNNLQKYPEYIQTLKQLFYDRNEHYMVRSSAAYPLSYFNLLSQEKEKAIRALFEIMHSIPPAQKDSRFMGRVILSLQEITGEKYQSPEEWEKWYKKNFLKGLS